MTPSGGGPNSFGAGERSVTIVAKAKERLLGTAEVARRLERSVERVRQLGDAGRLPVAHRTLNGARFFAAKTVEAFLKERHEAVKS